MESARIEIYTSAMCGYCHRAKQLLRQKGAEFEEINVDFEPAKRRAMAERAEGATTVPQVFADGVHLGGCDDIHALEDQGRLDEALGLSR